MPARPLLAPWMATSISRPARWFDLGVWLLKGRRRCTASTSCRDIKTDNIHLGQDGVLRILDLGVAVSLAERKPATRWGQAGTPSHMAPGAVRRSVAADGLRPLCRRRHPHHLLTRKYPYGEIEPFQAPGFGDPARPTAGARNSRLAGKHPPQSGGGARRPDRFRNGRGFCLALERGARRPLPRGRCRWFSAARSDCGSWWRACRLRFFVCCSSCCGKSASMKTALILFAHGARVGMGQPDAPAYRRPYAVKARTQGGLAFLEFMTPTLPGCIASLIAEGWADGRDADDVSSPVAAI